MLAEKKGIMGKKTLTAEEAAEIVKSLPKLTFE